MTHLVNYMQLSTYERSLAPRRVPARYIYASFAFMATFNLYSLRLNLSVAIVDMVNLQQNVENLTFSQNYSASKDTVNTSDYSGKDDDDDDAKRKFSWNESQQGLLLSAYFYGYIFTQVPGAHLGRRFGRVRVLGICVLGSSTLSILFPFIARGIGLAGCVATRILIGLLSGVTMPILFAMTSVWAPVTERSKLISIQFAGIPMGTCVVLPVAGLLVGAYGWESIFYATGGLGILWAALWFALIYDTPEDHPRMSAEEKRLCMGPDHNTKQKNAARQLAVPWISILTSKAWICLAFTHFASLFGKYQLMTMLPSYLKTVLNFDVKSSGILSSIPFILGTLLLFVTGPLADCLIARNFKSIYVRKALTTSGLLTSSISISIVTYIGSSVPAAMTLFTLSVAMDSLVVPGFKACIMEIAPEFSGIAYGLSNTVSTLSGITAPQITGVLRQKFDHDPLTGWRASFWIGGAIYFLGALVFLIFGTNKKQPWASNQDVKKEEYEIEALNARA